MGYARFIIIGEEEMVIENQQKNENDDLEGEHYIKLD